MHTQYQKELRRPPRRAFFAEISASGAPLDPAALLQRVRDPQCGGLVLFSGDVRECNHGRMVARLEYEVCESLAIKTMRTILTEAADRWSLGGAGCVHRVGVLEPGASAVLVVTAAPHRAEAYDANQYIMRRIKHEVPIWKKEVYADGTHQWGPVCEH